MAQTVNATWQQAVRDVDVSAMAKLLEEDSTLVREQIVHTRGNGTTYGVLPLEMVNKSPDAVRLLLDCGADPNRQGDGNALPIHNATLDVMALLLDSGADVNKIGYEECTPVMYETYMKNHDGVKLLINRGADVNYQRKLDGLTSLHFASQKRDDEMVDILLAAGADPSIRNDDGKTPIDIARDNNAAEMLARLENAG